MKAGAQRKLVVFGLGPFADMVVQLFQKQGGRDVVARTVHQAFMPAEWAGTRPLVPFEALAAQFGPAEHDVFVALEHNRLNAARADIVASVRALGYGLASFVSPTANIATGVTFGEHCFVMDGAMAQYGASFGDNCVIHANAFFGQNCRVGSHNYFGPGFFADRHAWIGSYSVFGSQVRVGESLAISDWTFVKSFLTVDKAMPLPTFIHTALRTPGYIIDRRRPRS